MSAEQLHREKLREAIEAAEDAFGAKVVLTIAEARALLDEAIEREEQVERRIDEARAHLEGVHESTCDRGYTADCRCDVGRARAELAKASNLLSGDT